MDIIIAQFPFQAAKIQLFQQLLSILPKFFRVCFMHDFSQKRLAPAFISKHFIAQMDKTTTKVMKKNYSQKDICVFEIAYSTRITIIYSF